MIRNIIGRPTQDIYDGNDSRQSRTVPAVLHDKARRLLDQINVANSPDVLRRPPGNRLEKLKGRLGRFWSIRINEQWRVILNGKVQMPSMFKSSITTTER